MSSEVNDPLSAAKICPLGARVNGEASRAEGVDFVGGLNVSSPALRMVFEADL